MVPHRIHIAILLLLLPVLTSANFRWSDNCLKAYDACMRLDFVQSNLYINAEKKQHPENLTLLFIESQRDFLNCFISEDKTCFEQYRADSDRRIEQLKNSGYESPYTRLFIGEIFLQLAVLKARNREYLGAAYDGRKAYLWLEENRNEYPAFLPNLKGLGFIHSVIGSIPKNYQWIANLFGLYGTTGQGISELKKLYSYSLKNPDLSYLQEETIILLNFLELNLEKPGKREQVRNRFFTFQKSDQHPLIILSKCSFHFHMSENDSVLHVLQSIKDAGRVYRLKHLYYVEGIARLNKLDYSAETSFNQYLQSTDAGSYRMSSYLRLAWIRLLKGDEKGYMDQLSRMKSDPKARDFNDEDKSALRELNNTGLPNQNLLKARLLFDGGYYNQAILQISKVKITSIPGFKDQLEFTYRFARIQEKRKIESEAISYYEKTIANGKSYPYVFAANSALILGELFESKGDKKKAAGYYKAALEMRNHDYQNSIDQKAKAGLQRTEIK